MTYAKDIRDLNHVKSILDVVSEQIAAFDSIYGTIPEDYLERINYQLCEIEEFVIGPQQYTSSNIFNSDMRMMGYWDYLNGKYSFWNMLEMMKKYEGDI